MADANRRVFIAWAPRGRRSEVLAKELAARLHFIHYLKFQTPRYAPVKYILQSVRTLQRLFAERPEVVFVQSPPFVCALVVYLYCRLTGARYVLDHHTASFARVWDWALPIQKFLARRAITNLVTGQHWAEIIRAWSADAFILTNPFVALPEGETFSVGPGFSVAFINTFAPDEPIDAVLRAASQLPDVRFYITGSTQNKPAGFFADAPGNVTFTGFLPDPKYFGLLRAVHAVLALTTRNHTFQEGGWEAASVGTPLITSDWPYLQEVFAKGTVYAPNTGEGIRDGILAMQNRYGDLKREMATFPHEVKRDWDARFAQLKEMISRPRQG
jgi:glycosyltransferase involved in cell wall biosynthesis